MTDNTHVHTRNFKFSKLISLCRFIISLNYFSMDACVKTAINYATTNIDVILLLVGTLKILIKNVYYRNCSYICLATYGNMQIKIFSVHDKYQDGNMHFKCNFRMKTPYKV